MPRQMLGSPLVLVQVVVALATLKPKAKAKDVATIGLKNPLDLATEWREEGVKSVTTPPPYLCIYSLFCMHIFSPYKAFS